MGSEIKQTSSGIRQTSSGLAIVKLVFRLRARPGGMRGAFRRPSRGRRAGLSFKACLSFLQAFLDQVLDSEVLVLSPSIILPRRVAHSARLTPKMRNFRPFGVSWLKKWCSKRLSKNDQILIPFRYWILALSAPFWDAAMPPKSIKIKFPTHSCFCIDFYISTTNETNETSHESNETKTNGPTKPNETTDQEAIFERNRTRPISRVIILIPANGKN